MSTASGFEPQAAEGRNSGTVSCSSADLARQCGSAVDNWRCATGDTSLPVNMEQACKWDYGPNHVQARFTDVNDAFSWKCYAVGAA